MRFQYTPQIILEKRRRALISLALVVIVTIVSSSSLLYSNPVDATRTYTWNQDFSEGITASTTATDIITLAPAMALTDTTAEDFYAGYSPGSDFYTSAVSENYGGELTLNQGWAYTTLTNPGLSADYTYRPYVKDGLLYVGTWAGGLSVINTQGTETPTDDTLVTRYHTGSTPALASNYVYHVVLSDGLLYVGTWGGGVSVINTQGTETPTDDTLVTRYHTGSNPGITNNRISSVYLADDFLYIATYNGLSVINTQGTETPTDDTLVTQYHTGSTPALASNHVYHVVLSDGLLYVGTWGGGVSVINTQGTATSSDDSLAAHYSTSSIPALASDEVAQVLISGNVLYFATDNGVSVINTQGTETPTDDTLVTRYHTGSNPGIVDSRIRSVYLADDFLYIATYNGVSVINTQGTETPADDTLETTYTSTTVPRIASDVVTRREGILKDPLQNVLYLATTNGLSVVNLNNKYNPTATYLSYPRPINITPTSSLAVTRTETSDHTTTLSYRTGTSSAVWRDDFTSATGSYAGDLYNWGSAFQNATVTDGVLTLSNASDTWGAFAWFDTGFPAHYFATSSIITARVRAVVSDGGLYGDAMFFDDWAGGNTEYYIANEWVTVRLIADGSFSVVGFEPYKDSPGIFNPSDEFQIDWIQIVPPDTEGFWNSWSTACTDAVCPINPADLTNSTWIQYRVDLATDNEATTPQIKSVSFQGDYAANGIYQSTTEVFDETMNVVTFNVVADTPASTTISYEYTIDNGMTWTPVTPGATLNQIAESFAWRATLSTENHQVTPTIHEVSITAAQPEKTQGTSIERRIEHLVSEGRHGEAVVLQERWSDILARAAQSASHEELIPLLVSLKGKLEELLVVMQQGE